MAVRRIIRKAKASLKLDSQMVRCFAAPLWNHETNLERFQSFWNDHKEALMAWWLSDEPLKCDEPIIKLGKLEDRLFCRPALWWTFEAKEPLKHYMVTRHEIKNSLIKIGPRPPGFKDEFCLDEEEHYYLKRNGLLSDIEKQTEYKTDEYFKKYKTREISRYLKPANATACSHWKCHIHELDWKDRLGFAYGLGGYHLLKKYLNQKGYLKANLGNPYA